MLQVCLTVAGAANPSALTEFIDSYQGVASRTAVRLRCREVDDVVQEAFERILRAFRNGNGRREHAGGYVMTVVRNVALTAQAATILPAPWSDSDDEGVEMVTNAEDVALTLLAELPEQHRHLAWMHWVEDRPLSELAPKLGYPSANAAAQSLQRIRAKLAELFHRKGVM